MTRHEKEEIKKAVVRCLAGQSEIRRIVIFGSFVKTNATHDIDVAIFQESDDNYLDLAVKYRWALHPVSRTLPVDVVPIRPNPERTWFLKEIEKGEVIYRKMRRRHG